MRLSSPGTPWRRYAPRRPQVLRGDVTRRDGLKCLPVGVLQGRACGAHFGRQLHVARPREQNRGGLVCYEVVRVLHVEFSRLRPRRPCREGEISSCIYVEHACCERGIQL